MRALERRKVKGLEKGVSFFGLGALSIGRDWGIGSREEVKRPDEKEAKEVLHAVLDKGINIIDTASAYHRSEERIGKYLSTRRNEFYLASKCGEHNDEPNTYYDFSYQAIKESIGRSLALLQTDEIDIMQIHFGPNPEEVLEKGETLRAMKEARKEGRVKLLGASIDGNLARQCIESGDFDIMQMEYHLLNQKNRSNIQLAKEKGIGVFIRTGLGRGMLTARASQLLSKGAEENKKLKLLVNLVNKDYALLTKLALHFLYETEGISSVLIGTKSTKRLDQNMRLLEEDIDPILLKKAIEIGMDKL